VDPRPFTVRTSRLCLAEQPPREFEDPLGPHPIHCHGTRGLGDGIHPNQACSRFGTPDFPAFTASLGFSAHPNPPPLVSVRGSPFAARIRSLQPAQLSGQQVPAQLAGSSTAEPTAAGGARLKRSRSGVEGEGVNAATPRSQFRAELGEAPGSVRAPTAKHTRLSAPPPVQRVPLTPGRSLVQFTERQDPHQTPPADGPPHRRTAARGDSGALGGLRELQGSCHSPSLGESQLKKSAQSSHSPWVGDGVGARSDPFVARLGPGEPGSDLRVHDSLAGASQRNQLSGSGVGNGNPFLSRGNRFGESLRAVSPPESAEEDGERLPSGREGERGSCSNPPHTVDLAVMAGEGGDGSGEGYEEAGYGRQGEAGSPRGRHTAGCSRFRASEEEGPSEPDGHESSSKRHSGACGRFSTPTRSKVRADESQRGGSQAGDSAQRGAASRCDFWASKYAWRYHFLA